MYSTIANKLTLEENKANAKEPYDMHLIYKNTIIIYI